jgi:hypothetical protein
LVEGDKLRAEVPRAERLTRFNYDALLIAAFMDRWRPETHTFHFSVGKMTLSLEDVDMLGGLPCAGESMGRIDIPARIIYVHAIKKVTSYVHVTKKFPTLVWHALEVR